jgi:hypothetical protein
MMVMTRWQCSTERTRQTAKQPNGLEYTCPAETVANLGCRMSKTERVMNLACCLPFGLSVNKMIFLSRLCAGQDITILGEAHSLKYVMMDTALD